jgi:NADH-quinone oxidoreductase subunit M
VSTWTVFGAALGVILSAAYALWLYRRVIFGQLTKPSLENILDIDWREAVLLVPLVVLTILYGVFPAPILDATAAATKAVVAQYQGAVGTPAPIVMPAPADAAASQ